MDVFGCLNHKWLKEDNNEKGTSPEPILILSPPLQQQQQSQSNQILTVQTSNVTILNTEESVDVIKSCTTHMTHKDDDLDDDEDKENNTAARPSLIEQQQQSPQVELIPVSATSTITFHATTNGTTTTSATKLVLEKSSSISLFPAIAPTTPKVCRKMIYEDEADLKEIVKKYQTSCCDDESVGDCLICQPPPPSSTMAPSIEIDKGITSC